MEVLNTDPRQLSPLNLAFIGDCVYEMQVRCHLVALANRPVNDLRPVLQAQSAGLRVRMPREALYATRLDNQSPNGGLCPHGAAADRGRTGGV